MKINTLAWANADERIVQSHEKVLTHFDLPVAYTKQNIQHGFWMNEIMRSSTDDVVIFMDSDCVPTNKEVVIKCYDYALKNNSFIGIAQCSNHIFPCTHVFAAPAFFFISRRVWFELGCPTFSETPYSDVAENVTYAADRQHLTYRALYPTHFERPPQDGIWRLGNYGYYGVGTHFNGGVYHLYQGRNAQNVDLFVERCNDIVAGSFDLRRAMSCIEWDQGHTQVAEYLTTVEKQQQIDFDQVKVYYIPKHGVHKIEKRSAIHSILKPVAEFCLTLGRLLRLAALDDFGKWLWKF